MSRNRNFYWSDRNEKLVKTEKAWKKRFGKDSRFVSFNIPRLRSADGQTTCPYAGICTKYCYADQGRLGMPMQMGVREDNLEKLNAMTRRQILESLEEDLDRMKVVTHIRIHDSGDFFARWYYETWLSLANTFPDHIFYAYTKSIPFLNWKRHPENFRVTQSVGGKRDKDIDMRRPHARVFVNNADRKKAGYCDGNASDLPAVLGQTKIGLVYHGVRNLDEGSQRQLRVVA